MGRRAAALGGLSAAQHAAGEHPSSRHPPPEKAPDRAEEALGRARPHRRCPLAPSGPGGASLTPSSHQQPTRPRSRDQATTRASPGPPLRGGRGSPAVRLRQPVSVAPLCPRWDRPARRVGSRTRVGDRPLLKARPFPPFPPARRVTVPLRKKWCAFVTKHCRCRPVTSDRLGSGPILWRNHHAASLDRPEPPAG